MNMTTTRSQRPFTALGRQVQAAAKQIEGSDPVWFCAFEDAASLPGETVAHLVATAPSTNAGQLLAGVLAGNLALRGY